MGGSGKKKQNQKAGGSHSKSPSSISFDNDPHLKWAVECSKASKTARDVQLSKPTLASRAERDIQLSITKGSVNEP